MNLDTVKGDKRLASTIPFEFGGEGNFPITTPFQEALHSSDESFFSSPY